MDTRDFEAALRRDGFSAVLRDFPAGTINESHAHDYDVRALVTHGSITLQSEGREATYRPGETFTMAAGSTHREVIGPDGVRFVAGRRAQT